MYSLQNPGGIIIERRSSGPAFHLVDLQPNCDIGWDMEKDANDVLCMHECLPDQVR